MDSTVALAEFNARDADESSASAFDRYDISSGHMTMPASNSPTRYEFYHYNQQLIGYA
jgi:hypothetical protein